MSDSEDDFMSDKFLVNAPDSAKTYSSVRQAKQLKSHRTSIAKQMISSKALEEERRRTGLNTSLFDSLARNEGEEGQGESSTAPAKKDGASKAMGMMMKMGWKVGEGLGRKRSPSPIEEGKRRKVDDDLEDLPRVGIGSSSRLEPIRVSMWAGRKGLSARAPTPPPLPLPNRDPDALDPEKLARLGKETESFRDRQRREFSEKEVERKESKARELLVKFDLEQGIKFHPLHILPLDPLGTLPKPLLRLIYPNHPISPTASRSPSPTPHIMYRDKEKNMSAAEKMREQLRRDMLSDLPGNDEEELSLKAAKKKRDIGNVRMEEDGAQVKEGEMDWESFVVGSKKVLSMTPAEHLTFLVSQLRHEHLYCFWCSYKYRDYAEMEGIGGCPGEDEDDH